MTHTVTVTGYNSSGEGVARLDDGRVVFMRRAARGDLLEIRLTKEQSRSAFAEIVNILEPSQHRIKTDCTVYLECGGCDYRHITYEEELYAKKQCVNDALKRIGGLSVQVNEILNNGLINNYRNKVVLHSDGVSLGYYKTGSHDIVPVKSCLLLKDELNEAIKNTNRHKKITLRTGKNGLTLPLEEELDGLTFKIEGFFQINTEAALLLFNKAREYAALNKDETMIDLYCGVGALTLYLGRDAGYAIGVENNPASIKAARENAKRNNLSHIEFINADAASWNIKGITPDCVVVDPPRKGLSSGAVQKLLELSPKRLIYISCNPATLARDLKSLSGYIVRDICAVDMFPRTANIECCCLLEATCLLSSWHSPITPLCPGRGLSLML